MLGERLRRFRLARGMSLNDLAVATNRVVSSQTLSKYEHGDRQPSARVLNQIAAAFGVKSSQLWGKPPCHVEPIAFRKSTRLRKKEQERIESFVAEEFEKRIYLQTKLCEASPLELPILKIPIRSLVDTETAALQLRDLLNLGIDPIANLIRVLEDHGIHIIEIVTGETFDGISAVAQDPYNDTLLAAAIATRTPVPGDRQRLNITHELGHLILALDGNVDAEKAAFRFGAAFLAPAEQLHYDVGDKRNKIKIEELVYLKKRYGLSIQAILFRLKDLEIITDTCYKNWCIQISQRGWKKQEPVNIPPETPKRFGQQVQRALSEDLITKIEAGQLLNMPLNPTVDCPLSERARFFALPKEERDRILSEQAEAMVGFYENDTEWREWEGGSIIEYDIP